MPTARMMTPIMVPQTLTRPGLMVVEPRKAPTSAGRRYSSPTLAWPILSFEARRDSSGRLLGMPRKLLALRGEGLRLKAGRRYRIVALYDNPTADTIPGAMGIIGGLFVPDDLRRWPAIDVTNADYRLDLELLGGAPTMAARRTPAGAQHE